SISVLPPGADDSAEEPGVHALDEMTIGPGSLSDLSARLRRPPALGPAQLDEMLRWLQSTIGVLQSAVGSSGFLQLAAESLVQIIGLHSGRVLLFDAEPFSIAALFPPTLADRPWQPSQHVLGMQTVDASARTKPRRPLPFPVRSSWITAGASPDWMVQ